MKYRQKPTEVEAFEVNYVSCEFDDGSVLLIIAEDDGMLDTVIAPVSAVVGHYPELGDFYISAADGEPFLLSPAEFAEFFEPAADDSETRDSDDTLEDRINLLEERIDNLSDSLDETDDTLDELIVKADSKDKPEQLNVTFVLPSWLFTPAEPITCPTYPLWPTYYPLVSPVPFHVEPLTPNPLVPYCGTGGAGGTGTIPTPTTVW